MTRLKHVFFLGWIGIIVSVIIVTLMFVLPLLEPLPIREYETIVKRLVKHGNYTIVHDVDFRPEGARALVAVETKYGVRSIFFLRPHQDYFLTWIEYFRNLSRHGWKIGFHYNSLSRANGNVTLAKQYFNASICYLRSFFNIQHCHGHGDVEHRLDISNRLPADYLAALGVTSLEAENFNSYIGDTNRLLRIPAELNGTVFVNIHADWW